MTAGEEKHRIYLNEIKRQIKQPLHVQAYHAEENADIIFRKRMERSYDELFGTADEDE